MKQYCRYCAHLVYGDVCYCEKKKWVKTYDSCKQRNKCKDFELNPIDAFGENLNGYKPREKKQIEIEQQTLFDIEIVGCVSCGAIIPEGRQICPICEKESESKSKNEKTN